MQLDISIEQEEIIGYFDPDKVDKILYNLLSNAFKYNREGKTIRVNVSYGSSKRSAFCLPKENTVDMAFTRGELFPIASESDENFRIRADRYFSLSCYLNPAYSASSS